MSVDTTYFDSRKYSFPLHKVDYSKVKLTESPLDDFQRLYFTIMLLEDDKPREELFGLDPLTITYNSSIANNFLNPTYSSTSTTRFQNTNSINCFEYNLPSLLSECNVQYLKDALFKKIPFDTDNKLMIHNNKDLKILKGDISFKDTSPATSNTLSQQLSEKNTVSKNQQFKLQKIDHTLNITNNFINPNNCVIWDNRSGHVFITGIWRLYQDVMNALSTLPRIPNDDFSVREESSLEMQKFCKEEFDFTMNKAFYDFDFIKSTLSDTEMETYYKSDPNAKNTTTKRRRRSSSVSKSQNLHPSVIDKSGNTIAPNNKYSDFHWNIMPNELKFTIVDHYKKFLVEHSNISIDNVKNLTFADILQRIRGGYIKIQGTWLPLEIAKPLCVRFCFPIRYLMVPLFGNEFPKLCEDYFKMHNHTFMEEHEILSPVTKPSTLSNIASTKRKTDNKNLSTSDFTTDTTIKKPRKGKIMKQNNASPLKVERSSKIPTVLPTTKLPDIISPILHSTSLSPSSLGVKNQLEKRVRNSFSACSSTFPVIDDVTLKARRKSFTETLPSISSIMSYVNQSPNLNPSFPISDNETVTSPPISYRPINPSDSLQYPSPMVDEANFNVNPTLHTLSNLTSIYNTRGHRYSYPMCFSASSQLEQSKKLVSPPPDTEHMSPQQQSYYYSSPSVTSYASYTTNKDLSSSPNIPTFQPFEQSATVQTKQVDNHWVRIPLNPKEKVSQSYYPYSHQRKLEAYNTQ